MTVQDAPRPKPPIGFVIVLLGAAFLYIGMMANVGEMQDPMSDAMGRGMAGGFALVLLIAEWVLLAVLLLIAGVNGEMPAWSAIAAVVLVPGSGFAAGLALYLLDHGGDARYGLVPGLLAPAIAGYALWARLPILHRRLPPVPTSLVAWLAVAVLAAAPVPRYAAKVAARPVTAAPQKTALQILDDDEKETRRQMAERFRRLTPRSPLWDYDNFFDDPEFGAQAIAAARQLVHRQADAEAALREGLGFPLARHLALDLAATPAFCAAAGRFLIVNAREHHPPSPETDFLAAQDFFKRYEDAMRWLIGTGCNLDVAIAGMREVVASYKSTDGRDAYLAHLSAFK